MINISIAPFNLRSPVILVLAAPTMPSMQKDKRVDIIKDIKPKLRKYGESGINDPITKEIKVKNAPKTGFSGSSKPNSLPIKKFNHVSLLDVMVSTHEFSASPYSPIFSNIS